MTFALKNVYTVPNKNKMSKFISFESFVTMTAPFKKRRMIYFNDESEAKTMYGDKVYGCFIGNKAFNLPEDIPLDKRVLKIDAQVVNGHNLTLGNSRMTLFYKGVNFTDINVDKSFPEWNEFLD